MKRLAALPMLDLIVVICLGALFSSPRFVERFASAFSTAPLTSSTSSTSSTSVTSFPSSESSIRAVLDAQVSAWNRGDIPEYMNGYWKSDKLVFVGSSGVTRGWQATLERYNKNYPDRKTMGHLTFRDLEITVLNLDAAFVLGKWHLKRGGRSGGLQAGASTSSSGPGASADPPDIGGVFSLVLRKFPEGWRIIADHTSVVP